jgi:hypothetical protein
MVKKCPNCGRPMVKCSACGHVYCNDCDAARGHKPCPGCGRNAGQTSAVYH